MPSDNYPDSDSCRHGRYTSLVTTMRFLKENWIWILAPIVVFAAAAAYLYLSRDTGFADAGTYDLR